MRRFLVILAVGCTTVACDALNVPPFAPVECTLIGCGSLVAFDLSTDVGAGETYDVEVCIDGACENATVEVGPNGVGLAGGFQVDAGADRLTLNLPEGDYSGTHALSLSVDGPGIEDFGLEVETEFERGQPNGPDCPPVCWRAIIRA